MPLVLWLCVHTSSINVYCTRALANFNGVLVSTLNKFLEIVLFGQTAHKKQKLLAGCVICRKSTPTMLTRSEPNRHSSCH